MGTLLGGGYGHDNTWENGDERGLQGQGIYKNHGHVRLGHKSAEVGRFPKGYVDDIYVFMSNTQYNHKYTALQPNIMREVQCSILSLPSREPISEVSRRRSKMQTMPLPIFPFLFFPSRAVTQFKRGRAWWRQCREHRHRG